MASTLLVTGGAGYIGSHILVALAEAGYRCVVLDNLSNGHRVAVERAAQLTGSPMSLIEGDVRDKRTLHALFRSQSRMGAPIDGVIHLAGCKAVAESVSDPLMYYDVNVCGTATLVQAMRAHGVRRFVFSSSATVYGAAQRMPVMEHHAVCPANPYGRTKLFIEELLRDVGAADPSFSAINLRYFNPIGAHPSGCLGESPHGIPANVFPFITQVAMGVRPHLAIFGDDYDTRDGTGVRDYLHVMDLADGHVKALQYAQAHAGVLTVNLGTGQGVSVYELVRAFEHASGQRIAVRVSPRRAGDVSAIWANADLAEQTLGWKARRSLEEMCVDGWRWQRQNPAGYDAAPTSRVLQRVSARSMAG
ncbi:UDP-glucose 4-epimerase GalE [Bordetella genomosp. 13]|uniref:UDP-glucose 4-epimerase GalE n=1 Tax=Bordetella genomosp. 13 TaxID=463040 RepID=UPI0011A11D18|nr:UDP-glucose 4-epimerase GalE [Bordetella genomosp. 13]